MKTKLQWIVFIALFGALCYALSEGSGGYDDYRDDPCYHDTCSCPGVWC